MLIRIFSFLFLSLIVLAAPTYAQSNHLASASSPAQYIGQLFDSTLSDFRDRSQDRVALLRTVLEKHFQLLQVSKFVAGHQWRQATEQERSNFTNAFSNFLALTAVRGLEKQPEITLSVTGEKQLNENSTEVMSVIAIPESVKIPVNWIVENRGDRYEIDDIVFLGISMRTILRDYITSSVAQAQNNLGLYAEMLKKLAPISFSNP